MSQVFAFRVACRFVAASLTLLSLATAQAELVAIAENGPVSNRVNIVFLGDGYTSADHAAGTYSNHVSGYVDYMFSNTINSDPFFRYRNFFNVYRVDVVSNESGADQPQNGIFRDTALDATYQADGVTDRFLYLNEAKADAALTAATAGTGVTAHMRFVTVNDTLYGGGGGNYAVFAGGNASAREIALHEIGHSFSQLVDEYAVINATYTGFEPGAVNVTKDPTGAKWSHWLGYEDPTGGIVGAYEGGMFFHRGIYRPTLDSKMRTLGVPFNAIAREKFILDIYDILSPLDDFTLNAETLVDPASLWAMRVDDDVIQTEWFINGQHLSALDGLSSIDVLGLGLGIGLHTVELRAFDPTGFDPVLGWVRIDSHKLEQFVAWDVLVTVPEPSALALAACGVLALTGYRLRRRGGP